MTDCNHRQPPQFAGWMRQVRSRHRSSGISLVEALVALAVMGFGMVGLVGMQAALRNNADISKQRSEAVRIAEEHIEDRRAYSALGAASAGQSSFGDINAQTGIAVPGTDQNTSFVLSRNVVDHVNPRRKTVTVEIAWDDRNGQAQSVALMTGLLGTPPELAGALSVTIAGSSASMPGARHRGVPRGAVPVAGTDTSRFDPPGAATGVGWIFNNLSGQITNACNGPLITDCGTNFLARLLTGYVRFATLGAPSAAIAAAPPGNLPTATEAPAGVGVRVDQTYPALATIACFGRTDTALQAIEYFCAVPVTAIGVPTDSPPRWSGRAVVTGPSLAPNIGAPHDASLFRVCRYTSLRSHAAVPSLRNEDHPLDYAGVTGSLVNQNFLVIRAGDYGCPDGVTPPAGAPIGTPPVGRTWHHQPSG